MCRSCPGSDAANAVNQEVRTYTDELLTQFYRDCERVGEGYQDLRVSSVVLANTDTWFTLRIDATQTEASSYAFSRFYHIDKATGQVVSLGDLFRDGADYTAYCLTRCAGRWRHSCPQTRPLPISRMILTGSTRSRISILTQREIWFWIFDEYGIAAGSMGMPEFTMEKNIYQSLLKEEYQKG